MRLLSFLFVLFCLPLSAQNIVSVESQNVTLAAFLNLASPVQVTYNTQNYKILYTTTDALGQPDTASGLIAVPLAVETDFPLMVYNHGTVGERNSVPSNAEVQERLLISVIAGTGYIGLAPDYIGLGESDGIHPYVHAKSEASAGRDLILAAKQFLQSQDIGFTDQLFITGYSQGGHASQALHRDIETNPGDDDLTVTAAAHLSGPYSISDVMAQTIFSEELATLPGYIAYTYVSYNFVYGLYQDLGEVFVEPYLAPTRQFASEEISLDEYNAELVRLLSDNNAILADILQDSIVEAIRLGDPTAPINVALADNDTYDWAPVAPTLLYYCTLDEQVPFRNAILADSVMRTNGSTSVVLENGGARTHGGCVIPAITRTLDFWRQFAWPVSTRGGVVSRPDVSLAPNPVAAGSELRIEGLLTARHQYVLYDPSGRQVTSGSTTAEGQLQLPTHLGRGLHVLRVGLEDGSSVVRKVVVR